MMKWILRGMVVAALLAVGSALAADDPGSQVVGEETDPTFILANQRLFEFRADAGGYTPAERWVLVNHRIREILSGTRRSVRPDDVWVKYEREAACVCIGAEVLVCATPADAAANRTSTGRLARRWARRLRAALVEVNRGVRI